MTRSRDHAQLVTQVEAETGTSTDGKMWSPERVGQAITALGGVATDEKSLNQPGELITVIGQMRWYPTRDITLINITANVGLAATGANIVLDVKKNGVSILASNITILATEFTAAPVVPTDTTLLTTDYLTVDILQIGLSLPGEDLVVNFKYQ